jgi:hypothetical protein
VDPISDPLFHRKSGSAGNIKRDLRVCSQELLPPDWGGGRNNNYNTNNNNSSYNNLTWDLVLIGRKVIINSDKTKQCVLSLS